MEKQAKVLIIAAVIAIAAFWLYHHTKHSSGQQVEAYTEQEEALAASIVSFFAATPADQQRSFASYLQLLVDLGNTSDDLISKPAFVKFVKAGPSLLPSDVLATMSSTAAAP
jgi:hypothetical protein